jgi:GT2 family glycosyltransferase
LIPTLRISVVIPTHNGAATLAGCLESLQASTQAPYEIIVVDDASTHPAAEIASRFDCRVERLEQNIGAARAKNRGAALATGDVLLFTDDDVIVAPGTLEEIARVLDDASIAGVVGLLDARIPFDDFSSNYKNLWMRFTYERLPRERIGVFYTSIAAMRRETFQRLGGFDENYGGASIAEDTEFGQRAWGAGCRLVLDPLVTATHCKHYRWAQVLATDFARARALMLMRLRKRGQPFYTSVPLFYQLAVPAIFAALACLVLTILHSAFLVAGATLLAVFYALNTTWLGYLARRRGLQFALVGALFQPVDVIAVGLGMAAAGIEYIRGVRY